MLFINGFRYKIVVHFEATPIHSPNRCLNLAPFTPVSQGPNNSVGGLNSLISLADAISQNMIPSAWNAMTRARVGGSVDFDLDWSNLIDSKAILCFSSRVRKRARARNECPKMMLSFWHITVSLRVLV